MLAEDFPTTSIVMQPKQSNESLDMVVDEGMIKLGKDFFKSFGRNTVFRKKSEIDAC